jgi:hypothetical protein
VQSYRLQGPDGKLVRSILVGLAPFGIEFILNGLHGTACTDELRLVAWPGMITILCAMPLVDAWASGLAQHSMRRVARRAGPKLNGLCHFMPGPCCATSPVWPSINIGKYVDVWLRYIFLNSM